MFISKWFNCNQLSKKKKRIEIRHYNFQFGFLDSIKTFEPFSNFEFRSNPAHVAPGLATGHDTYAIYETYLSFSHLPILHTKYTSLAPTRRLLRYRLRKVIANAVFLRIFVRNLNDFSIFVIFVICTPSSGNRVEICLSVDVCYDVLSCSSQYNF